MRLNRYDPMNWRRRLPIAIVLFCLVFFRYCYYGFEYFPQLDDYIQYHNYTAYNSDLGSLISILGLLASRPLAGLMDLYFWSGFFDHMIWAVALISALYTASAMLLHRVFFRRFGTGMLFFVVYALLPLGFEGAYWVSASSRIIVGMFFASASLLFFDRWCREGGRHRLVLFGLFQFICFCFYEQVMLLSCALTLVIMLLSLENREKRALWGFLMFAGVGLYFILTSLAPSGVYGERSSLYLPWQEGWLETVTIPLRYQLEESFSGSLGGICGKGLARGFGLLVKEPNILWTICAVLLSSVLFILVRDNNRRGEFRFTWELLCGLFLAAAPLAAFFVLKSPWFGVRNILPSLCGLGLGLDALFDLVFCRVKKGALIQAAVIGALALLCSVASVSELHDYREIRQADAAVAQSVAEALPPDYEEETTWILNVDPSYLEECNLYYHEHGYGVTSSDWALTGTVQYYEGRKNKGLLTPVSSYEGIYSDVETVKSAKIFFYGDGQCLPAWLEELFDSSWSVVTEKGEQGRLDWENGFVSLTIK